MRRLSTNAVGVPETFELCAELVRPGGTLAGFFYFDDNERGLKDTVRVGRMKGRPGLLAITTAASIAKWGLEQGYHVVGMKHPDAPDLTGIQE